MVRSKQKLSVRLKQPGGGEGEVLLSFHCTQMTQVKNLNDLPSRTTASEPTSVLVIFAIKMDIYVCGTADPPQLVILPGAQVLVQLAVLVLPVLPSGERVSCWTLENA